MRVRANVAIAKGGRKRFSGAALARPESSDRCGMPLAM
jgi:hypothetical protein